MTTQELIEALCKAEGPNGAIDAYIGELMGWTQNDLPKYTESLDDALSLIPNGRWWSISAVHTDWEDYRASFDKHFPPECRPPEYHSVTGIDRVCYYARVANAQNENQPANGSTPSLALCAAALKARTP